MMGLFSVVEALRKYTGASMTECKKAADIAIQYIRLRGAIGDRPNQFVPREYILVPKREVRRDKE